MDLSIKSPAVDTYRIEMTSHSSDLLLHRPLLLLLHEASQSSRDSNETSRKPTVSQTLRRFMAGMWKNKSVWMLCGSDATFCMASAAINHTRQANKKQTKPGNAACLCGFWAIWVYNHFSSDAEPLQNFTPVMSFIHLPLGFVLSFSSINIYFVFFFPVCIWPVSLALIIVSSISTCSTC